MANNYNLYYIYIDGIHGENAMVVADHGDYRREYVIWHDEDITDYPSVAREYLLGIRDDSQDGAADVDGWDTEDEFTINDYITHGFRVIAAIHADWIH